MEVIETNRVFDPRTVADPRKVCFCTSFRRTQPGRILASFRLGSAKDSADGNCLVMESSDNGRTWATITERFNPDVAGAAGEIRVCELAEANDDAISAFLLWVDHESGKAFYDRSTDSVLPTKLLATRSADHGRTWDPYTVLDTGSLGGPALSGPTVTIPGHGLLVPFENFQPGTGTHSAHTVFRGQDGSPDRVLEVARDPADRLWFFDERHARCRATTRLVAMFWGYDRRTERDVDIQIAWADPQTLRWAPPRATGIQGQVAQPIPLGDGRLLAFYVHRHPPGSLRLIASEDGGQTWDRNGELIVYDSGGVRQKGLDGESDYAQYWDDMLTNWNFGHPTSVVLDDGTVLLGYYAGEDARCLSVWCTRVRI